MALSHNEASKLLSDGKVLKMTNTTGVAFLAKMDGGDMFYAVDSSSTGNKKWIFFDLLFQDFLKYKWDVPADFHNITGSNAVKAMLNGDIVLYETIEGTFHSYKISGESLKIMSPEIQGLWTATMFPLTRMLESDKWRVKA